MNINEAYPSKYLKADVDIPEDEDLVLTVKSVEVEQMGDGEDKPVVYFNEIDKGLVLNKTNANAISNQYGAETDGWTGKKVALFATEVEFAGKMTLGIRVRLRVPKGQKPVNPNDDFAEASAL